MGSTSRKKNLEIHATMCENVSGGGRFMLGSGCLVPEEERKGIVPPVKHRVGWRCPGLVIVVGGERVEIDEERRRTDEAGTGAGTWGGGPGVKTHLHRIRNLCLNHTCARNKKTVHERNGCRLKRRARGPQV